MESKEGASSSQNLAIVVLTCRGVASSPVAEPASDAILQSHSSVKQTTKPNT